MSGQPPCLVCGAPRVIGVPHRDNHWEHLCLTCWMWAAAAHLMSGPTWGEQRECPNLAQKGPVTLKEIAANLWDIHWKSVSDIINEGKFELPLLNPELVDPEDLKEP